MGFDDPPGDGQPQAGPSCSPVARFFAPVEAFENQGQVFRLDALPGIAYFDAHALRAWTCLHLHFAAGGGVPQRVADQVVQYTADALDVHQYRVYPRVDAAIQANLATRGQL